MTLASVGLAETRTVAPKGEYAQIDTRLANETIQILAKGAAEEKQRAIGRIKASPENYAPPVFYVLSGILFDEGKKDEAAFWFYAGQLRARFDANRCADESARQAVDILNQSYGTPINQHTFRDTAKLEQLIPKVVEWDRRTPHNYDHRWINLHGMGAIMSGLTGNAAGDAPLSLPREQWNEIAEKTRADYLSDFQEAMKMIKRGKAGERRPFAVRDGQVWYTNLAGGRYRVAKADPATFEHIGGIYGRDKQHVFYAYDLVEGADPVSFIAVGHQAGRDANAVYFGTQRCPGCDVASFRQLDVGWYADKNNVYHGSRAVPGVTTESFERLNNWFAKDAANVYLSGRRIPGVDAASFKLASCGECEVCGEDKNRCYWFEHPVPCDCKSHSGAEFPGPMVDVPPGKALLTTTAPISLDATALGEASHGMSAGYLRVDAGKHALALKCWNNEIRRSVPLTLSVDLHSGRLYRIVQSPGTKCDARVERPAMVRGRKDGPEIQIRVGGNPTPKRQIELAPGAHTLTVVCRDVNRTGVAERAAVVTLDVKPGDIYDLLGNFTAPEYKCDVQPVLLGAS